MPQRLGIDVSHHNNENSAQHKIDWNKVATDRAKFCIIKASENRSTDVFYAANHRGASNAGLLVGAYHFMRVGNSGKAQAETFLSAAKLDAGNLLPSLDVEVLPGSSEARKAFLGKIGAWLDIVSTKIGGKQPFIYTRKSMSDDLTKDKTFADYPLWVANYKTSQPKLPASWNSYVIWQYAEDDSIDGIGGHIDGNAFVWHVQRP